MTVFERNELIRVLIFNYQSNKENDKLYHREPSSDTLISQGKLLGALMALGLDMDENEQGITIKMQSNGNVVLRVEKDPEPKERR